MEIIPVLDIMNGVAVHARFGRRDEYRPLSTPLCRSSNPFDVVDAYLDFYEFRTIYLADLDGIIRSCPQRLLIAQLTKAYSHVSFWVDAGWPSFHCENGVPVIGTESMDSIRWQEMSSFRTPWVLSIDHRDGELVGPLKVMEEPKCWPEHVINMNLSRVGSSLGPDLQGLSRLSSAVSVNRVVAAGGVRGMQDLKELDRMGIGKVLVASALHHQQLSPDTLR